MDVTDILRSIQDGSQDELADGDYTLDTGYLTVTNTVPIDVDSYNENIDQCIEQSARDSIQKLMGALFSLPTTSSPDGPLAILPPPVLLLPREKPLPKPKEPTKWEKFAAAKGIKKTRREKKIWDEEKQEWVQRWGWKGKNKEVETQWLHEVPSNADVDNDPRKNAKDERKARIAKNERQRLQNLSHTSGSLAHTSTDRKKEIDHVLATTRTSTASMGKFDRQLDGEKKPRGLKRKFDPIEASAEQEKKNALALLSRMESDTKKMRGGPSTNDDGLVNVRKAIRLTSKRQGSVALARKLDNSKKSKR
ncbi:Rhodanese- sulfurtransferase [Leucoagaricus gongylophorus]